MLVLWLERVRVRGGWGKIGDCTAASPAPRWPRSDWNYRMSAVEFTFVYVTRPAMLRAMSKYALPISWV